MTNKKKITTKVMSSYLVECLPWSMFAIEVHYALDVIHRKRRSTTTRITYPHHGTSKDSIKTIAIVAATRRPNSATDLTLTSLPALYRESGSSPIASSGIGSM